MKLASTPKKVSARCCGGDGSGPMSTSVAAMIGFGNAKISRKEYSLRVRRKAVSETWLF